MTRLLININGRLQDFGDVKVVHRQSKIQNPKSKIGKRRNQSPLQWIIGQGAYEIAKVTEEAEKAAKQNPKRKRRR